MRHIKIDETNQNQFVALGYSDAYIKTVVYTREAYSALSPDSKALYTSNGIVPVPTGYVRVMTIGDVQAIELTEEQLEALIDKINSAGTWVDDYYTSNDDNPIADYVTWGWKEGDIDGMVKDAIRFADDETAPLIEQLLERNDNDYDKTAEALVDCSDLTYINGIRAVDNQLYSMSIGEVEDQLPDEFFTEFGIDSIDQLTEEQQETINRRIDYSLRGDCLLTCHDYSRWSLIIDSDRLAELVPPDLKAIEQEGYDWGASIAKYQDVDFTIDENESRDRFMESCSESEENARSYSPFEYTAKSLNDSSDPDGAWSAFDEGVSRAFADAWKAMTDGQEFNQES